MEVLYRILEEEQKKGLSNKGIGRSQQVALAMAPKFTSGLSILCSAVIINEIAILDRSKIKKVYHRLLLAISVCDIFKALGEFCSTWPIPENAADNIAWNIGTQGTCIWQASWIQFGIVSPLLNMSLSMYYVLVIRYGWTEARLHGWVERCMHVLPVLFAASVTIAGVFMDLYNSANLWCWIAPYPANCLQSYKNGGVTTCERGDNASIFQWAFYYVWVWFAIAFVMVAMGLLYHSFVRVERANRKYAGVVSRSKSRDVAIQGMWYVVGFYMTYLFATLNRLLQVTMDKTYYPMLFLHALMIPSQGIWNFFVYVRPRVLHHRGEHPDDSLFKTLKTILYDNYIEYVQQSGHDADNVHREWESFRNTGHRANAVVTSISGFQSGADPPDDENADSFAQNDSMSMDNLTAPPKSSSDSSQGGHPNESQAARNFRRWNLSDRSA